ncbi:hypothetical protein TWF225_009044 [Orbilia oligospora]|uniref:Uncharacterized protein n=1 Tax=Orbilia oligospora TaxID=2813651 RepID=A0A7C8PQN1_ORBOL|nr:hypothetical protein TWF751_006200 [Orbilia oligospora]KAF3175150.1 hypothetical protein TWF225_009044 [Orbilia oligospora]KAF3241732.1 hypothetical protein TWF128_010725 [Orbilia oligospora]KAF3248709.1 hypothetical protein TWF217_009065 [Orbilia oligospora]KAF3292582.1 hypothetical protein TWF132_005628 [Orbilia oligospora]
MIRTDQWKISLSLASFIKYPIYHDTVLKLVSGSMALSPLTGPCMSAQHKPVSQHVVRFSLKPSSSTKPRCPDRV